MLRIVADEKIPFLEGVLEPYAEIKYLPGSQINRSAVTDADGLIIRTRTKCTESLLKGTNVRFAATATIGFDHIDTHYCETNNIMWTNAPGCNSSSVQQYIAAALLKLSLDHHFRIKDRTIGIVGVGNVGSKVEKLARVFGMNVLLNDPPRARREGEKNFVPLETVLEHADIITLHVPLNIVGEDNTYHLFDRDIYKKIKKGTWLINSSRGEVVETACLKAALRAGKISGSIIDVWENEPDIDRDLLDKTYLGTPHIAGYSTDGKANGTAMIVNELARFFDLPLKDWYPEKVPAPFVTRITIDGKGKDGEEIIREAVSHSYDITEDDTKLRFSPSDFEKQRGDYRIRREFSAYTINLINSTGTIQKLLKEMGFNLVESA